jgi:hypothetical protein
MSRRKAVQALRRVDPDLAPIAADLLDDLDATDADHVEIRVGKVELTRRQAEELLDRFRQRRMEMRDPQMHAPDA